MAFALVSRAQEPVAWAVSGSCWSDFEHNITYILEILHAQPLIACLRLGLKTANRKIPYQLLAEVTRGCQTSNALREYEGGISAINDIQQVQLQPRQVSQSAHSLRCKPSLSNSSRVFVMFLRRALTYLSAPSTNACMSLKPVRSYSGNSLKACVRCATKLSTVSCAETATR